jgi:16S rRNA (cytosine1402-N4)-methyltransferase
MEGPYSARFPSSPVGEKSRRAPVLRGAAEDRTRLRHPTPQGKARHMAAADDQRFDHRPVMLDEIVAAFAPVPAGWIIDATLGGAGHASAVLAAHPHLSVLGIDQDPDAVTVAAERLSAFGDRARVVRARFDAITDVVADEIADAPVVGALFDLGVSSPQVDRADRGFSYRFDAPLDMRMDPSRPLSAMTVVNEYDEAALARVLRNYGDERFASRISRSIIASRPVTTTGALAEIVRDAIPAPARRRGGHPAKRTFQAIRIEVNDELGVLPTALDAALEVIVPGGRLVVLSYHSGEDRIVKQAMRLAETGGCTCPLHLPCVCGAISTVRLVRRGGVTPSAAEQSSNPRAESARLRIAERI